MFFYPFSPSLRTVLTVRPLSCFSPLFLGKRGEKWISATAGRMAETKPMSEGEVRKRAKQPLPDTKNSSMRFDTYELFSLNLGGILG